MVKKYQSRKTKLSKINMVKEIELLIQNHQEMHLWIAYVAKKPRDTCDPCWDEKRSLA